MYPKPKTEDLYQKVRNDILRLELSPGEALRLPALSDRYQVGQTPLRECLNRLCGDGLATVEHNKGFRVSELSLPEILELENARAVIEGTLFSRAVSSADEGWERDVAGAFHMLLRNPAPSVFSAAEDINVWARRHNEFHETLINVRKENGWLVRFRKMLGEQLQRYHLFIQLGLQKIGNANPENARHAAEVFSAAMAHEPHQQLYEVALSGDADEALKVFEQHSRLSSRAFSSLASFSEETDFFALDVSSQLATQSAQEMEALDDRHI